MTSAAWCWISKSPRAKSTEGQLILERVDVAADLERLPKVVTADAGYAYAKVYDGFEQRGVEALIPCKSEPMPARPSRQ